MGGMSNKFIAVFDQQAGGADAFLQIVETNQFKALTHLSLSFRKANDDLLKKHLSTKIKESMQNKNELDHTAFELNQRLQESQREREQMQGDLAQAREEVRRVSDAMQIDN